MVFAKLRRWYASNKSDQRKQLYAFIFAIAVLTLIFWIVLYLSGRSIADAKGLSAVLQSIVTPAALIIGGVWAYRRYFLEATNYPHLQTSAEINFIGEQEGFWIVEVIAILENKGKVQHQIKTFRFDLNAIFSGEKIETSQEWGGQVNFPQPVAEGSFIPEQFMYFIVGPSVTAKYSYVARVPRNATFLILHCWFKYSDDRGYSHTMEKTVRVPNENLASPLPSV